MIAPPSLVLDLLEWVAAEPREYSAVMEAWRTSCPRLPVWEDAVDGRLIERVNAGPTVMVRLTDKGRNLLSKKRA